MTNPNPARRKNILPGLQVPTNIDPELAKFLQAVKEHLQVASGAKGQPRERFVTLEDLARAGIANVVVKGNRGEIGTTADKSTPSTGGSGPTALSRLSDVDTSGVADGAVLLYEHGRWGATYVFPATMQFDDGVVIDDLEFSDAAELTAALNVFTDALQGVVPASGGGTDNFLRADGTWASPPGGGGTLVYSNTTIPAGNTVANSAVETTFESTYTIPADELEAGSVIRVRLAGVYSTDASVAPTLQLRVKLGGQTIIDTAAVALATSAVNDGWYVDVLAIAHSIGATGELEAQGLRSLAGELAHVANTSTFTIDTTGDLALEVTAQWGTADEDNTVTLREMVVYVESVESGSGGGVSDHGELTGLADDDHPQYILRSILTTTGDLLVQGGSGAARLAIGAEGQVLKVVSGAPAWADEAGGGGGASDAADVAYDNSASGLDATDVQAAIDELASELGGSALPSATNDGDALILSGGVPVWVDAYRQNVVLLLGFEGSDAATTATDESRTASTVTFAGNAQIDTAQFMFGASSLLVDGSGDFISVPHNVDFDFAAGDFTIEFFLRPASVTGFQNIIGKRVGAGFAPFSIALDGDKLRSRLSVSGAAWAADMTGTVSLTVDTWTHVALVRRGSTIRQFVGGVIDGSASVSSPLMSNASDIYIGAQSDGAGGFSGHIDELRITKGVARYTRNFTPPAAPFTRTGL